MPRIAIGIPVHSDPERLERTLDTLRANTGAPYRLLLLGDGADEDAAAAIAAHTDVEHSSTEAPEGGAACFNRLLRSGPADYYLLLENGSLPAPGWLDALLTAFRRYPACGLAGPSTNRGWNEQSVFGSVRDTPDELARVAQVASRRFGQICRSLEPLYSLSDFCYMARRETVETIGLADESYGLGPCWEMDYNIRAVRAGIQGLWACASYVHRVPFSPRRENDERQHFEASRRLYQDKFCGLHLRGIKSDYREHCRGAECPNFAPAQLIDIRHPRGPAPRPAPAAASTTGFPLVSCIMPTYNRRLFVPRSIRCFLAQDYPNLELLVVDDGSDPIADLLPADPRIQYYRLSEKLPIGAKRNYACERARGDFIAHWDDDDWYGPARVTRQILPLLDGKARVSGTSTEYYFDHDQNQAFRYQFRGAVIQWMGSLAYPKSLWDSRPFEPIQVAEDVKFLAGVPPDLRYDLRDPELCIAGLHPANASPKATSGSFWSPESPERIRALLGPDAVLPGPAPAIVEQCPLVSCIMPTFNRRAFIPLTLQCFAQQSYPSRELVVVDDGADAVGDLLERLPYVRYIRANRRMSIGAKRNLACEHAGGEFIAHWDDDDWYAPERLARQIEPLRAGTHDLTGLVNSRVLEMPAGVFWSTSDALHARMFVGNVHGGTLVYRRSLWLSGIRYPEINLAEDAYFIQRATQARQRLERLSNPGVFVYLRHGRNTWQFTSGKFLDPSGWTTTDPPPAFSPELLENYRAACLTAFR